MVLFTKGVEKMLHNNLITKEDVTTSEFEKARYIRTIQKINFKDSDLMNFYVEWNNVCYKLKQTNKQKRR